MKTFNIMWTDDRGLEVNSTQVRADTPTKALERLKLNLDDLSSFGFVVLEYPESETNEPT